MYAGLLGAYDGRFKSMKSGSEKRVTSDGSAFEGFCNPLERSPRGLLEMIAVLLLDWLPLVRCIFFLFRL